MKLEWKKDEFGRERHALYLGRIYVGSISRMVSPGWREWEHIKNPKPSPGGPERQAQHRKWLEDHDAKPWRVWFMSCEDGDEYGWYATDDEARQTLEARVRHEIETE